jgi:hypothetical protein
MGKICEVEIGGHLYRYEYKDGKTIYLGPVGQSPALSEADFLKVFDGFKEQEHFYQEFAKALDGEMIFYGDDRSVVHEEDIGREVGGKLEVNMSFFEGEQAFIERDIKLMELVIIQYFDEETEDMPTRTDIKYETNKDDQRQEFTVRASEATTGLWVNPNPKKYAEAVMERIRDDYVPPDERFEL